MTKTLIFHKFISDIESCCFDKKKQESLRLVKKWRKYTGLLCFHEIFYERFIFSTNNENHQKLPKTTKILTNRGDGSPALLARTTKNSCDKKAERK